MKRVNRCLVAVDMMKTRTISHAVILLSLLLAALGGWSCGADDTGVASEPASSPSGLNLAGLVNGRTLIYFQTDTITTVFPVYEQRIENALRTLQISGSSNSWVIAEDSTPMINLAVTAAAVLHNGYWRSYGATDSLVLFDEPAEALHRTLNIGSVWFDYTPEYVGSSGSQRRLYLTYPFGYYFSRTYTGTQSVTVPAGQFTAYVFETELFVRSDDLDPVARMTEYYADGIGLVKQVVRGQELTRVMNLVNYY